MLQSQGLKKDLPKFVIASTSYLAEETFLFEAEDDSGKPKSSVKWGGIQELSGLAKRWGNENWESKEDVVNLYASGSYVCIEKEVPYFDNAYLYMLKND
jgi:hypothetical protein